jgi:hypothetical protein
MKSPSRTTQYFVSENNYTLLTKLNKPHLNHPELISIRNPNPDHAKKNTNIHPTCSPTNPRKQKSSRTT